MSNRFLGILIIIGFIGSGYIYYHLLYLPDQKRIIKEQLEYEKIQLKEEKKEPELIIQIQDEVKLTNSQRIEEIKQKNKNYKTFKIGKNNKAYFKKELNKLVLYLGDEKIGIFDLVYKEYLKVDLILGTKRDLYIEVGADKFYYNDKNNKIFRIELNIPVVYVKLGINHKLIFVTNKGSFVYSIYNNTLEYFSYFNDFVYFKQGYLGLVKNNENRILNNLGIKTTNNLVVYYNSSTKEKKIIYSTDLIIDKIYIENNKFYILTIDGEIYELENI